MADNVPKQDARLAALDAAIARGLADAEAGHVKPLREVFERLVKRGNRPSPLAGEGVGEADG
jgi:predicted transcriptional regulator